MHDYVIVYAKDANTWEINLLPRTAKQDDAYSNPDSDPRGPWKATPIQARNFYSKGRYSITTPSGRVIKEAPKGTYWRIPESKFRELDENNEIWWGENKDNIPAQKRFLTDVKQGVVPTTLWLHKEVGNTAEAKNELREHVEFNHSENVLHTVKPTRLLQRLIQLATKEDEEHIVLDFFSGSASAAHAIFKQNRADSGKRRFILVQLPEPLPKPEGKLENLADIGKERLRSVIKKMKKNDAGKLDLNMPEDLGFRIFKLAPSGFKPWQGSPESDAITYNQQLDLFRDPLKEGWQPEAVIWEVALKEGYPLTSRITQANVAGHVVYRVANPDDEQQFHICLEREIMADLPRQLSLDTDDLFVCRDLALDDSTAANLALQCRLKTI